MIYCTTHYFILIKTKRKGIAAGRNLAIEKAAGDVIAMIDAGCVAKKDWLANPFLPFDFKTV